jgi:hypothetical protein
MGGIMALSCAERIPIRLPCCDRHQVKRINLDAWDLNATATGRRLLPATSPESASIDTDIQQHFLSEYRQTSRLSLRQIVIYGLLERLHLILREFLPGQRPPPISAP